MHLSLLTPTTQETYEIIWAELNTENGNYVIKTGHAPTILALSPNKPFIYCLKNGKEEIIMVKHAIAEITRTSITVLFTMV